jgi:hypothetical protein
MSSTPNPEAIEPQEQPTVEINETQELPPAESAETQAQPTVENALPQELTAEQEDLVKQYLAEADAAAKAEDWEQTIALYRKALAIDRIREGVEAKLQWALRMRDIDKLYRDGKAKFDAGDYAGALPLLRKVRVMYASHYKDTDELIVQAQSHVQQDNWDARPDDAKGGGKRSPIFFVGAAAIVVLGILMLALLYYQGNKVNMPQLSDKIPAVSGNAIESDTGLIIVHVQPGSGAEAQAGKAVSVHYTGYLTDGTQFDSSIGGEPITFLLGVGQVIEGWDEGISGMRVGEKRRLIIPPQLGYGARGAGGVIPPNATLVFDVELTDVQ